MGVRLYVEFTPGENSSFEVDETFDQALDKVFPLNAPSSALEQRAMCLFTDSDSGTRLFIPQRYISAIQELTP